MENLKPLPVGPEDPGKRVVVPRCIRVGVLTSIQKDWVAVKFKEHRHPLRFDRQRHLLTSLGSSPHEYIGKEVEVLHPNRKGMLTSFTSSHVWIHFHEAQGLNARFKRDEVIYDPDAKLFR